MAKLNKRQKKDKTCQEKMIGLKRCPHCIKYKSMGGNEMYYCDYSKPPTKLDLVGYSIYSYNPCNYDNMVKCVLLGGKEGGVITA